MIQYVFIGSNLINLDRKRYSMQVSNYYPQMILSSLLFSLLFKSFLFTRVSDSALNCFVSILKTYI